ncbi:MAG: helix-turn-helix domain-containing protein [Oscillospiraceae bacterium]|nr:helix-turn-helix domain-containing protein [Oscillospiraceae bacterium]
MDSKIKRGQILKELRIKKGLKQNEIASLLKITPQAYQRYEYGTSEPNADGFAFLADFYNVSVDYLFGRENKTLASSITQLSDTEIEKRVLQAYFQLDPKLRAKIWAEMATNLESQIANEEAEHEICLEVKKQ